MIIDDFILSSGVESDTLVIWLISVYVPIQHLYILIDGIESSGGDPYPHGKEIGPGSLASSFSKFFFAQTHTHSLSMSLSTPNCLFKTRLNTHTQKQRKKRKKEITNLRRHIFLDQAYPEQSELVSGFNDQIRVKLGFIGVRISNDRQLLCFLLQNG